MATLLPWLKMLQDDQNEENAGYETPPPPPGTAPPIPGTQVAMNGKLPPGMLQSDILPVIQGRAKQMAARMLPAPAAQTSRAVASPGSDASPAANSGDGGRPDINPSLLAMLQKQAMSTNEGDDLAEQLAKLPKENNYGPLLGLIDSWTGSNISSGYHPPPSEADRIGAIAKAKGGALDRQQKLTSDLVNLYKSNNSSDSSAFRGLSALAGGQEKASAAEEAKQKTYLDRQESELSKLMDPTRGRTGEFGKLAEQRRRVNQLEALKIRQPDGNFTKTEMEELGEGLTTLIKGGNVVAENAVRRILPSSFKGTVQDVKSWLKNEPQGREQQAFVTRLYQAVKSESETIDQQIDDTMSARLPQFYQLEMSRPKVYDKIVGGYRTWLKQHPAQQVEERHKQEADAAAKESAATTPAPKGTVAASDLDAYYQKNQKSFKSKAEAGKFLKGQGYGVEGF